jgi:cation transport ATPase
MYVSYALNVAMGVAAFIISYVFFNSSMKQAFIAIIISMIVAFPYVMRLSRNIYINMFVTYDENFKQ